MNSSPVVNDLATPCGAFSTATQRLKPVVAALLAAAAVLALAGCKTTNGDVTGSIHAQVAELPGSPDAMQQFSDEWGKRYEADPLNPTAAMNYGRALRGQGRTAQAVAVLQGAVLKHPNDLELIGAYGKALADSGRLKEAADVLARAHTPERPNWSILSAQGAVADQLGDNAAAQRY